MEVDFLEILAKYRIIVGYLGEKDQFDWWQSSFFTPGSDAFLSPLFGRTRVLAQCNGVTHAAALVHDERIGVGYVYHLFRLPEDIEQGLHQTLHDPTLGQALQKVTASRDMALGYLRQQSDSTEPTGVGPIRVGNIEALRDQNTWQSVTGAYLYAFEHETMIFPYFTDIV
jgi:hypothetical protein